MFSVTLLGDGQRRLWQEHHGHGVEYTAIYEIADITNPSNLPPRPRINPLNSDEVEITFRIPIPVGVRIEITLTTEKS